MKKPKVPGHTIDAPANRRVISVDEARAFAAAAGFTGDALDTIVAIAQAESGLDTGAINYNRSKTTNAILSTDKGILQINDRWHPEVSEADAFNPATAFVAGYAISHQGTYFNPWVTYLTDAYVKFMPSNVA